MRSMATVVSPRAFLKMVRSLAILLALSSCLTSVAAESSTEVWMLSLFASNDSKGACQAAADKLGQEIQDKFNAAVPGFTTYYSDNASGRFLRNVHRDLQVRVCSKTYCSKPANWDWCLWNGCSCSCGQRRELTIISSSASDNAMILQAKRELDVMLNLKGLELGCELGLAMQKVK